MTLHKFNRLLKLMKNPDEVTSIFVKTYITLHS